MNISLRIRLLLFGLPLAGLLAGCVPGHFIYSTGPYRGKVLDAETKAPLVGAVVLAIWYREAAVFGGHGPAEDYHDALEVLTDAQGEFTVPAKRHFTLIGKILEPKFTVYYPGHAPWPSQHAEPHGKEVIAARERRYFLFELPKLRTRDERFQHATIPAYAIGVPDTKVPHLIRLVNRELKALGLPLIRGQKESN